MIMDHAISELDLVLREPSQHGIRSHDSVLFFLPGRSIWIVLEEGSTTEVDFVHYLGHLIEPTTEQPGLTWRLIRNCISIESESIGQIGLEIILIKHQNLMKIPGASFTVLEPIVHQHQNEELL